MSPLMRRFVYVLVYEAIAIAIVSTSLAIMLDKPFWDTGGFTIWSSVIATVWNFIFNSGFEFWEKRQTVKGRSFRRRAAHAISFEAGLMIVLAPFMAWYLDIGIIEALFYDFGYALFFLAYTYTFNLCFDLVVGLPESAR